MQQNKGQQPLLTLWGVVKNYTQAFSGQGHKLPKTNR